MAEANELAIWVASCVLVSLRVTPVLLFSPPFTLIRVPKLFLVLIGLGLAISLVSTMPEALLPRVEAGIIAAGALREGFIGLVPVVALQLLFASLYLAGRTIDVQAGFGLAMIIDPTTRAQVPLAGTIFAYAAGVSFFAVNGHLSLLQFYTASLRAIPLGSPIGGPSLASLTGYLSSVSLISLGIAGVAIAALFLCDIAVAVLSRTVPQMNALLLGIQVKAAVMFVALPVALGVSGALFARLVALALEAMPRLV